MRDLPVPDPGESDHRSASRYLWWLAGMQRRTIVLGMALGSVWMVSQALMPFVLGTAIQEGVTERDLGALVAWAGALLGLGIVQAVSGVLRHRCAVFNWLAAAYRTVQLTTRQAGRLGAGLSRRVASGEVVNVGTSDVDHIGNALDITARGAGALAAVVTVAVILLFSSLPLGLTVVLGVPALLGLVAVLIRPLHARAQEYRTATARLAGRAADIVTGLRVLRGVGGESTFSSRYRTESQQVRAAGVRVAVVQSWLEAAQVLLPGLFVVLVLWLGARFVVSGQINVGQLITFYGYAAFLVIPLRTLTELADTLTRGHVAARRVVRILAMEPELSEPAAPVATPDPRLSNLIDVDSGVVIRPGLVTALAAVRPEDGIAIADRLGRYVDSSTRIDGVPLADLELATVRRLVLVADNDARLFSGRLRDELSAGTASSAEQLRAALAAASGQDIIDALTQGLETAVGERAREFSGGQQQRLRLARALLADPPVLVLVEPTSAVDAHTEARIADRLGQARAGRTTVLITTSPLLLDRADHVCFVRDGRVVIEGPHRELLDTSPEYAATVTRGEDA